MFELDKNLTKNDVMEYFCDDCYMGSPELTEEFVSRVLNLSFDDTVSEKLSYFLIAWAKALEGSDAGYASLFVIDVLKEE